MSSDTEQLQQRNRELEILNEIAKELNRPTDLGHSLHTVLAQVAALLHLQTGWIFLLDDESREPYLAASQNLPPALIADPDWKEGSCYCLDTFCADAPAGAANVTMVACSRLKHVVDASGRLRYHASIPLYAQERKLGVLNVASTNWRKLSAEDLRMLHTVGDLLSAAIERARLFARSAQLGALEERNRLAREIHDTLAQGLTAIGLRLEMVDSLLERGADIDSARQGVQQALDLARHNLEEARRSVLDLRAAPLQGRTLCEALAELAATWHGSGNPKVTLDLKGSGRKLPPGVEIGLYRITQEGLNNIARHAQASRVMLRLAIAPDHTELVVEDDGRGFEPYSAIKGRHGLIGMNERAKLLGGWLRVRSAPGEGTRLEVHVPNE